MKTHKSQGDLDEFRKQIIRISSIVASISPFRLYQMSRISTN